MRRKRASNVAFSLLLLSQGEHEVQPESASTTTTLLRIPVLLSFEQTDRLAFWKDMNTLSIENMRRMERTQWKVDDDILNVWRTDLQSARGRGKMFGYFFVQKKHVFIILLMVIATILKVRTCMCACVCVLVYKEFSTACMHAA